MQQKLTEILDKATGWMTAAEIADKGGWRSPANVGVALQQMEKADGRVELRKSDTKKQGNGMPATEWKLTEKTFDGDTKPVVRNSRTTEAPAPVFTQPAHDNEVADLRAKLALAEKQRNDHFENAESIQAALETSDAKLGLLGTMLINIEGDSIEDKLGKVLHERLLSETKIADLEDDVRRHVEAHSRLSTEISHFLTVVQQLSGIDNRPKNLAESEEQIATAFNLMRGRVEELELAVDVAQQAVASMELAEEQAANDSVDVKDAAIGYLVRVPGKKTRICIKPDNARNAALSAARAHGRADVLALIPVGKAVKGAEWRDAA